jgi:RND family efflux transporter MFP subunit
MTNTRLLALCAAVVLGAGCVGAGCGRETAAPEAEAPTLDVTSWTDKTELFMEYPPLAAGQEALFAVHLTRLSDFSAMTAGRPRLEFTPESGGTPAVLHGQEPSRPGVFRVLAPAPPAGRYMWRLIVDAPGLMDAHDLGAITVFPDEAAAVADAESHAADDPAAISYLKEQQWTNGFATALVQEADIRSGIRVPAVVEPLTGGDAIVAAPADGRFMAGGLMRLGTRVQAGQELGRIQPRLTEEGGSDRATLAAGVAEAQASLEAARSDLARAERLLAERAVPARRVEEAQRAVKVAEARLTAAQARLEQRDETLRTGGGAAAGNSFVLRAPIAGRVVEIYAALGASYDEGAPLFRIVRTDRVELQALVPASEAPLEEIREIALEVPGRADPLIVQAEDQHDAGVIDEKTRSLPVQFDVDNRTGQLLIGQTVTAVLYAGGVQRMPVVPKEAVLMEAGRPYVFVHAAGESFSRRYIEVGGRDGDLVGIRAGVKPGDRVVTRGAYDVQLASAAGGLPAEGHVH